MLENLPAKSTNKTFMLSLLLLLGTVVSSGIFVTEGPYRPLIMVDPSIPHSFYMASPSSPEEQRKAKSKACLNFTIGILAGVAVLGFLGLASLFYPEKIGEAKRSVSQFCRGLATRNTEVPDALYRPTLPLVPKADDPLADCESNFAYYGPISKIFDSYDRSFQECIGDRNYTVDCNLHNKSYITTLSYPAEYLANLNITLPENAGRHCILSVEHTGPIDVSIDSCNMAETLTRYINASRIRFNRVIAEFDREVEKTNFSTIGTSVSKEVLRRVYLDVAFGYARVYHSPELTDNFITQASIAMIKNDISCYGVPRERAADIINGLGEDLVKKIYNYANGRPCAEQCPDVASAIGSALSARYLTFIKLFQVAETS